MDAIDVLRGFARNSAWANHRLYAACAKLPPHDLNATRTSFFPTILKTLNHNALVDAYYLDALTGGGRGRKVFDQGPEPFSELAPLRDAQRRVDRELIVFVENLKGDGALDVETKIARRDHVQVERTGEVLLHLFQHQIHHRGQVHAMLAGTQVAPPPLDEFFLGEELALQQLRQRELEELGLPLR